ncbi:methyltransferase domain-containing protein [Paenibacillus sp. UNC499MF]|uniref:methyltransferase domain-containing protein n=1 Tax=Paenibacillus sp. UNC499MF TaxID=1502751 RepID=UPI0008A04FDB|nr:methyltransferase domain-containing protein [Paenibacillus sp. UNC499MF]SEG46019.1 malonyl-CoA O-methyltransferase [Paenibacillus sp. UNC499MF]
MTQRSDKIRRQFDRSASGLYDRNAGVQRFMAEQLARLIRDELIATPAASLARIPAGNLPVLEIGCGTGLLTERLAALLPPGGELTAADLSPAMLEAAKSRLYARSGRNGQESGACPDAAEPPIPAAALAGLPPDAVRFEQADAEEWAAGAPASSYGLIASSACFQWFARPAQTLVHLRRLLKPHGRLAAATFGPATFTEMHRSFDKVYRSLEVPPQRHGLTFHDAEEWTDMLRKAGFGEIRITRLAWTEYFSSVKLFLTNIKSLGASTTNAARLPGLSTRRLFSSMFRQYEQDYGAEGRIPVTYEVLLILAV